VLQQQQSSAMKQIFTGAPSANVGLKQIRMLLTLLVITLLLLLHPLRSKFSEDTKSLTEKLACETVSQNENNALVPQFTSFGFIAICDGSHFTWSVENNSFLVLMMMSYRPLGITSMQMPSVGLVVLRQTFPNLPLLCRLLPILISLTRTFLFV
jgi:hypothetical protein